MKNACRLWGVSALAALSLTACGGGSVRSNGDGTVTGRTDGGATDNGSYYNGTYDNGTDNGDTGNGVTDFGDTPSNWNGADNGNTAYGADNGNTSRWNDDTMNDDALSRWNDSAGTPSDGNSLTDMTRGASDAVENGVQRARDALDGADKRVNP